MLVWYLSLVLILLTPASMISLGNTIGWKKNLDVVRYAIGEGYKTGGKIIAIGSSVPMLYSYYHQEQLWQIVVMTMAVESAFLVLFSIYFHKDVFNG